MSKTIQFTYHDVDYTLEYTRKTLERMEADGIVLADMNKKPITILPKLFEYGFYAHHKRIKKSEIEEIEIIEEAAEKTVVKVLNGKRVKVKELQEEKAASPILNFVVSTYYKGTGLEQLNKKLEEYLDSVDKTESQINYI